MSSLTPSRVVLQMLASNELSHSQTGSEDSNDLKRLYIVYVWRQIRAQRRRLSEAVTLSHELELRLNTTDPNSATYDLIHRIRVALSVDEVRLRESIDQMVRRLNDIEPPHPDYAPNAKTAKVSHN